jgi:exodeoxyribonuclease VII large subunit
VEQFALPLLPERRIFTVAELSAEIRKLFDREFRDVWVAGEISGVKLAASGHYYFTLKERDAQIRCVWFRSAHRFFKFKPQDGMSALARGRIDVYEARGEYQLLVEHLEPQGQGALQFAFEQLKQKLAAEGIFDSARKRPLPRYPARIGIVTSPRGAVIHDMLHILSRRFPGIHVRLYPAAVQGEGSAQEVARAIEYFSQSGWPDLVIVARGGGSVEDLWTFNEESVARAIAACSVPVVSAVGHETDVTITDFAADLRAPTPSAAAELVVPVLGELLERLAAVDHRLTQRLRYRLAIASRTLERQVAQRALAGLQRAIGRRQQAVDELEYRVRENGRTAVARSAAVWRPLEARLRRHEPRATLSAIHQRLDAIALAGVQTTRFRMAARRARVEALTRQLSQLSPLAILERGYAIATTEKGEILKDPAQAGEGSVLDLRLARGQLKTRVVES